MTKGGSLSAKQAYHQISRLQRAAAGNPHDFSAKEAVRSALVALLRLPSQASTSFLADVLHRRHGENAWQVAWHEVVSRGVAIADEGGNAEVRVSLGTFCMFSGRLDVIRAIVMRDALPPAPEYIAFSDRSQLLACLCHLHSPDLALARAAVPELDSLAREAGDHFGFSPHAADALALAWDVNPKHHDFEDLAARSSPSGAFVRSLLMRARMDALASPHAEIDADTQRPPSRIRHRSAL